MSKWLATRSGGLPEILEALHTKAKNGNWQAAKVYLDYVRHVITDMNLLNRSKPKSTSVMDALQDTHKAVRDLLAFAKAHSTQDGGDIAGGGATRSRRRSQG